MPSKPDRTPSAAHGRPLSPLFCARCGAAFGSSDRKVAHRCEQPAATASPPLRFWHPCHHCDGRGCEVCEETKGWWSVDAVEYDAVRDALVALLDAVEDYGLDAAFGDEKFKAVVAAREAVRRAR